MSGIMGGGGCPNGKVHLKFPFWLFETLPKHSRPGMAGTGRGRGVRAKSQQERVRQLQWPPIGIDNQSEEICQSRSVSCDLI